MTALRLSIPMAVVLAALVLGGPQRLAAHESGAGDDFEVWVIDQSDTTAEGGGTLYIYDGNSVTGEDPTASEAEVIDLGDAAERLCLEQTGSVPKRPHMLLFNTGNTHAVVAYVATGHVLFMDAAARAPLACIDVGEQAHAAFPAPDERYVVVANQNGKLLQRISTDYTTNSFTLDDEATLNLATCTTPSGAPCEEATLRPDTAPICPVIDAGSRITAVTLRGGGLFVVDSTATPMAIVAEYDATTVRPNGCGGVETAGKLYLNSGGGTPNHPFGSNLYAFAVGGFSTTPTAPNTPPPTLVFSHDDRERSDSHGAVLTSDGAYLWVADRAANGIVVVDTAADEVVNEIAVAGTVSDDPTPDLLDISPDGGWVFASLRGPAPLTANVPEHHNAEGTTPGLGIVRVEEAGRSGVLVAVVPITHVVDGAEAADPHALRVRRT
ncbi:MAG: YncE family protein [Thermomicrobiales bacterium]